MGFNFNYDYDRYIKKTLKKYIFNIIWINIWWNLDINIRRKRRLHRLNNSNRPISDIYIIIKKMEYSIMGLYTIKFVCMGKKSKK